MVKPKIFPKPRIGKNKFEEALKKDKDLSKKEIALLSLPKKIRDVSLKRERNAVDLDSIKITRLLNRQFINNFKKGLSTENRAQILHTHITNPLKKEFGTALPSSFDIKSLISTNRQIAHKYELISVIDGKTGKTIGYTTLKIKKINVSSKNFDLFIKKNINPENLKNGVYKKKLFENLSKIGIEVYFTPETGYRLDKNFNYVIEK